MEIELENKSLVEELDKHGLVKDGKIIMDAKQRN